MGATTRSVQRWIARGERPARRVGGRWRVASDALDAFVGTTKPANVPVTPRSTVPIATLFVANRGEIAARIRRTADHLGIRTVVPGEDGMPSVDLLDMTAVIAAARAVGADAIHPGYGFLAENADFAAGVEDARIRWVGPPSTAIRAIGDKASARRLAASLTIPILAGYDGTDQSDAGLAAAARRIGLPLLVKPAAGGGGKGMRVVRQRAALVDAFASARREASASFGDDRLVLERFLESPRHIEIQVLFDAHGAGVHLGERECTIQRRHQKVLEETPAAGLDPVVRSRMAAAALPLAAAAGYANAGTCEFLVDDRGGYHFLEMNTRLQVEHPVTEAVTGRDLIADQLAIAGGSSLASLGLDQRALDAAIATGGHAVEVRLYAEDAEDGFLPATGRVESLRWPDAASRFGPAGRLGIRVDAGIEVGTVVGSRFDPMLAKIVAHGHDRTEAFDRLVAALGETTVLGLVTNLRFLRWLVRVPVVVEALMRTDTLDRVSPPDGMANRVEIPERAWSQAARMLSESLDGTDGFMGGWRVNGPARLRISTDVETRTVSIPPEADTVPFAAARSGSFVHLDLDGRSTPFRIAPPPGADQAVRVATEHGGAGTQAIVVAPMPGSVLTVHVSAGVTVAAGDPIATLEAMKMEHVVVASGAGRIGEILVRAGDQVVRGQRLATVEP